MSDTNTPRYFRVSPKFWSDPKVEGWTDEAKLLALYLLTCPQRTTEGLFTFRIEYARVDLGWDPEGFTRPFKELLEAGFIQYDERARVMLIPNALRYQAPQNENQAKNAVKRLKNLPASPLTSIFRTLCQTLSEHLEKELERVWPGFGEPTSTLSSSTSVAQSLSRSSTSISAALALDSETQSRSRGIASDLETKPEPTSNPQCPKCSTELDSDRFCSECLTVYKAEATA